MITEPDWEAEFGARDRVRDDASASWHRMCADVDVTVGQRDAAANYCLSVARVAEAERCISAEGLILVGANGVPVKNPAITVINIYAAGIRAQQNALGLNPYSAARNKAMAKNSIDLNEDYPDVVQTPSRVARLRAIEDL
ncbi:P27 family phage terminase small subunit [Streptomyces sp. NBC_00144]|uniref:P27 family phage terminase small subunit n=1 Tax=Streptomyces sp. NBC_00144 TaxID=2975665 RepID=UPI00324FB92A